MAYGIVFLLIGSTRSVLAVGDLTDKTATRLEKQLKEMHCPGALIGVFPDKGQPSRMAIGVADFKTRKPMQLDMRMRIGSVSKLFVGTTVLRLIDEGKLSLDDPVSKYLEGVPKGDQITIRMLGNHTSGLFCSIWDMGFRVAIRLSPQRTWQPDEILQHAYLMPTNNMPGKGWSYSNTGAILLSRIVEKVTGDSFDKTMQTLVCQPLKLTATGYCDQPTLPPPAPHGYRFGKQGNWLGFGDIFCDVTECSASWSGAAGNMYSTLDDLGKAIRPLATGELLSEKSRKELIRWRETTWEGVEYGFLINQNSRGIGHEGNVPGFEAIVRYQPEKRRTIVVLTNLSNNADKTMPAEQLFDLLISEIDSQAQAIPIESLPR